MKIEIRKSRDGKELFVTCPYSDKFVAGAKKLDGKFVKEQKDDPYPYLRKNYSKTIKYWVFLPQNEEALRKLCIDIFGTDGDTTNELVTVKTTIKAECTRKPVSFHGRTLASAWGRDNGARLGEDVALLDGIITSGGSTKYWSTVVDGTFLVHNFPKLKAEKLGLEIVENKGIDFDMLKAEKERLLSRIGNIDAILAQTNSK